MIYRCCDERRRRRLRARPELNGIDYLEVVDGPQLAPKDRQRALRVLFVNPLADPLPLAAANLRVDGGARVRGLRVVGVERGPAVNELIVALDRAGDFSVYSLRLVRDALADGPPPGIDPRLAAIDFSFKTECIGASEYLTEFDCEPAPAPPAPRGPAPELDYLARDYQGLRRLMLDRLSALLPGWRERSPADLGVLLVELLAYSADHLAYAQDAIAGEAYLGTARRRVSVRRHAALVDYAVHEGCNARAWVQLVVDADVPGPLPAGTALLTRVAGLPAAVPAAAAGAAAAAALAVFETMHAAPPLRVAHNRIAFYTWSDERGRLPAGATAATLRGHLDLRVGDALVLEELRGPATGLTADADLRRRHAVRLTRVRLADDPLEQVAVTEVAWAIADALPFDLVLAAPGLADMAVARGNIVLADHGRTLEQPLGAPAPPRFEPPSVEAATAECCGPPAPTPIHPRFRPRLDRGPLTHADPLDLAAPAAAASVRDVARALPAVTVAAEADPAAVWRPRRDLLRSDRRALAFVAEIEDDERATLRFGDDAHGARPRAGVALRARYRVGNGPAGNLGAEALCHVVHDDPRIVGVRNPLPATGGAAPEPLEDVRQKAPHALYRQARAVTEADYAALAEAHPDVQRASAALRWTGSGYTASICVDRRGGLGLDAELRAAVEAHVEPLRMAGHDLEVVPPTDVPIELELDVCVGPEHLRGDVKLALQAALRRFFAPDEFTFGQPVIVSRLLAAAHAVPGVAAVTVTTLRRQGQPDERVLAEGLLRVGPREIVRLDNDPNFAERGVLRVRTRGGR